MKRFDMTGLFNEEPTYFFERIVFFLQSTLSKVEDPLALIIMALLFHNIGDYDVRDIVVKKLELLFVEFPDNPKEAGLQQRNCLFSAAYLLLAEKGVFLDKKLEQKAEIYINYCIETEWFSDPRIVAITAHLSKPRIFKKKAQKYLTSSFGEWKQNNNIIGLSCYCISGNNLDANDFGILVDNSWEKCNLQTLSIGLMGIAKFNNNTTILCKNILDLIEAKVNKYFNPEISSLAGNGNIEDENITHLDLAVVAYAIESQGLNTISCINNQNKEALLSLIEDYSKLKDNKGVILTRRGMIVFRLTMLISGLSIFYVTTMLIGLDSVVDAMVSLLIAGVITLLMYAILPKNIADILSIDTKIFDEIPPPQKREDEK